MITPLEIETKDFSKSMRGYNPIEVDDFLDLIIEDLEALLRERDMLTKKVASLEKEVVSLEGEVAYLHGEIGEHKKTEASVINTLDSAKVLVQDISVSAEKKADIIIKNAQIDAELIMKDAKEAIRKMGEECTELREKSAAFRRKYKDMLEDELKRVNEADADLFAIFDEESVSIKTYDASEIEPESDDEVLRLEDLIEDLTPIKSKDLDEEQDVEELDRHTKLMSELTSVFDSGEKSHSIPAAKPTMVIDSNELEALLKKEDEKRKVADKNTVIL